jgi:hypothetical protein
MQNSLMPERRTPDASRLANNQAIFRAPLNSTTSTLCRIETHKSGLFSAQR